MRLCTIHGLPNCLLRCAPLFTLRRFVFLFRVSCFCRVSCLCRVSALFFYSFGQENARRYKSAISIYFVGNAINSDGFQATGGGFSRASGYVDGLTCNRKVAFHSLRADISVPSVISFDEIEYTSHFLNLKKLAYQGKSLLTYIHFRKDSNLLPPFLPPGKATNQLHISPSLSAMVLEFFWAVAFAILATVSTAPIDGFLDLSEFTGSLPESLFKSYPSGLKSFTSSSFASPVGYPSENTTPIIPIDSFGLQSPESNEIPNVGGSNPKANLPMTIPVEFNLDSFNTAQANSGSTIECNLKGTQCSYCQTATSCAVYLVICNKNDPNDCALCTKSEGISVPICQPYTAEIKALPPPANPIFGGCVLQQCNDT